MIPGTGRQIVGWVGVAMLISSLTGIWLWWPLSGSVRRGFRWKRHRNLDTNLHHLVGFWISIPLAVLSFTGVWISFPAVFAGFDGARPPSAAQRPQPVAETKTPLATALAGAVALQSGKIVSVSWPSTTKPSWEVAVQADKAKALVQVDDASGAAKFGAPPPPQRTTLARLMRQIHDGGDTPLVWQLLVFLGGLIPAILAVTGIIMWWRARSWRGEIAEKRRAAA
jgi:uncharacterized iron-regulated membrane protein